jgi:DNA-binding NtrC family response regulator
MALRILIADDEPAARFGMTKALGNVECEITEVEDGRAALAAIRDSQPHLVFLDLSMPLLDGRGVLLELGSPPERCEIIVVTADDTLKSAIECMRLGAADYVTKPFEVEQLRAIARRNSQRVALEGRLDALQLRLDEQTAFGALVGTSLPMRDLYAQIERAARARLDILIQGETGTGKELIAREIHRLAGAPEAPFVAVNASAIAPSLAESELFGHAKGAFTGAETDRRGVFEQANGGTLFLDEVGDMPQALQAKVLRVLQDRVVQPVGSDRRVEVDVRVISATHQDLEEAIAGGLFRQDLFYRIRGIQIVVPPLRARHEDILLLAAHFLERAATRPDGQLLTFSPRAIDALLSHAWPGNVRELEQVVTAAAVMAAGDRIEAADLKLAGAPQAAWGLELEDLDGLPLTEAKARLVERFERHAIHRALETSGGNISAAARQLGIHRQSLQQKMEKLGIARPAGAPG